MPEIWRGRDAPLIHKPRILSFLGAALKSPSLVLPSLRNDPEAVIGIQIRKLIRLSERAVQEAFGEIPNNKFLQYLGRMQKEFWSWRACAGGPTLYALGRLVRPSVVVETGVAGGVSSAHILSALQHNSKGHLYSIDLGESGYLPAGKETGWIVPEELRDRWTLLMGDAKEVLPDLLDELGAVEIFLHDSDHSYEHMMWEFRVAWRAVASGGLLISDDIWYNESFFDFAKLARATPIPLFFARMGGLKRK